MGINVNGGEEKVEMWWRWMMNTGWLFAGWQGGRGRRVGRRKKMVLRFTHHTFVHIDFFLSIISSYGLLDIYPSLILSIVSPAMIHSCIQKKSIWPACN